MSEKSLKEELNDILDSLNEVKDNTKQEESKFNKLVKKCSNSIDKLKKETEKATRVIKGEFRRRKNSFLDFDSFNDFTWKAVESKVPNFGRLIYVMDNEGAVKKKMNLSPFLFSLNADKKFVCWRYAKLMDSSVKNFADFTNETNFHNLTDTDWLDRFFKDEPGLRDAVEKIKRPFKVSKAPDITNLKKGYWNVNEEGEKVLVKPTVKKSSKKIR